ncbi:MAG: hypothetical protein EIB84_01230 [Spiroplasma poulsonii]|uniref:Uncharacterized protein n=1 Tax=Spiroplasma poulsonii TaxID=2138 RepID=A0A2P6FC70_9MOLU|nr:hypothetical protein [Spiroplasma poulsonii]KAF0851438.1 hypothetical protein MSROBK_008650 [Spiroplasma poulsonii]MBW1241521.1 hypothetical protein [Spiroplasma poulsonii]PQM31032.1 hypothetical protein SMSRO_SF008300 [Spiroplasma poulsonii]PWF96030.1 hypothetical protein SMSE_14680 [Spiroplasma poulsonii]PWF98805.1 hypothetical protein SMH99_13680 [Spiroplasma poulsonii]
MSHNHKKEQEQIINYAWKMISLKAVDLKLYNPNITEQDVADYLIKIILVDKAIVDVSEIAYYIFNIKINRMIEFLNNQKITATDLSLEDFKDMFIK